MASITIFSKRKGRDIVKFIIIIMTACFFQISSALETDGNPTIINPQTTDEYYQSGYDYLVGDKVTKDVSLAIKYLTKAAKDDHLSAQIVLGIIYSQGTEIPKDDALAFKWFKKAAEQGNSYAEYQIGKRYYMGIGINKNNDKGLKYLNIAAEKNEPNALCFLGNIEMSWAMLLLKNDPNSKLNLEVGNSLMKCAYYWEKSAKLGHSEAQVALATLAHLRTDFVNCYMWLTIAMENNNLFAENYRDSFDNSPNDITSEQKEEAIKKAQMWIQENPYPDGLIYDFSLTNN